MAASIDQDFRRQRFNDLLREGFSDNKSEMARALGFGGPAYIRQLGAGERPITEKLVEKIHSLHGGRFKGWFAKAHPSIGAADDWPFGSLLAREEWATLGAVIQGAAAAAALEKVRALQSMAASGVKPKKFQAKTKVPTPDGEPTRQPQRTGSDA